MRAALQAWGEVSDIRPVGGGHRNTVLAVRIGGRQRAARWSRRPPASLDREIACSATWRIAGLRCPRLSRRWTDGGASAGSWCRRGSAACRRARRTGRRWTPNCGGCSGRAVRGPPWRRRGPVGDAACGRRGLPGTWAQLEGMPQAVIHGDPGASNIRVSRRVSASWTGTRRASTMRPSTWPKCPASACQPNRRPPPGPQ